MTTRTPSQRGAAARRKGASFVAAVRPWYVEHVGPLIAPMQETGADDLIDAHHGLSIECKNHQTAQLASFVDQAERQAEQRGGLIPVVVHKRAGTTDPGRWYVTLSLRWFARLLRHVWALGHAAGRQEGRQ